MQTICILLNGDVLTCCLRAFAYLSMVATFAQKEFKQPDIYFAQALRMPLTLMLYLYKAEVESRIPPSTIISGFDIHITF